MNEFTADEIEMINAIQGILGYELSDEEKYEALYTYEEILG